MCTKKKTLVETLGTWGQGACKLIHEVGKRIQAVTGEMRSTMYLKQAISMAVQRGNVISVLATLPSTRELDEIFYLLH